MEKEISINKLSGESLRVAISPSSCVGDAKRDLAELCGHRTELIQLVSEDRILADNELLWTLSEEPLGASFSVVFVHYLCEAASLCYEGGSARVKEVTDAEGRVVTEAWVVDDEAAILAAHPASRFRAENLPTKLALMGSQASIIDADPTDQSVLVRSLVEGVEATWLSESVLRSRDLLTPLCFPLRIHHGATSTTTRVTSPVTCVTAAGCDPSGTVMSGHVDGTVRFWKDGVCTSKTTHDNAVTSILALTAMYSFSSDQETIKLWNISTGSTQFSSRVSFSPTSSCDANGDARVLVVGCGDGIRYFNNLGDMKYHAQWDFPITALVHFAPSAQGETHWLIAGDMQGRIAMWSSHQFENKTVLQDLGDGHAIQALACSAGDGKVARVASGGAGGVCMVQKLVLNGDNVDIGSAVEATCDVGCPINAVTFSGRAVIVSADNSLSMWLHGGLLHKISGCEPTCLTWFGESLCAGTRTGEVTMYKVAKLAE
mmetsp:Transcript_143689/g.459794  ORF Transcript_143689/g.459794 Transcript_143689/m.459794 type:complete len:488 (+) Transcript_143689:101-1564(+)|eukprot:CAMPEP_0203842218 /NCGR_PEP_ID=MMETSP0359-20131031/1858_1 /ASSEMBLY_ACC=CAM_ASM_000338 /TAXON_ID=268821 /ORGANISM="Scrippsiella Hangoei, Strain SHTV-5" /LENGTH=487 /DNA_ID=CAMNT_0050756771 /DNA_START=94 /DNA_END=1557 /DNA_ORIENTATION=+